MKRIKPIWVVFLLIIISITLYFGLVVRELTLPGGIRLSLNDDETLPERNIEDLSSEELGKRQAELKKQFQELEQKVKQPQVTLPFQRVNFDLNGTWYGSGTLSYRIVQNGNIIALQEINPAYGIASIGTGQIQGQSIALDYQTVYNTQGVANLTVSPDGRILEGTFTDTYSGHTTPVKLNR
ncbi:hypothetical protein IQ250_21575 [Pseudanabaenaceae cyanobacterium LEGE 13415]|nr:hypothetical protein [Pseudanabaenaceae cyanobacterium LEGE 13415]